MIPKNTPANETASGDVVISVSSVSKTYRLYSSHQDRLKEALHPFRKHYHKEFPALNGITFAIRRGESIGILGRNGAGKSTLLQLIAGVLSPTSGTISVSGKVAALLELGAGFNPDITGRENVILASTILGIADNEIAERTAAVEAFADVGIFFDQPMKVYSSGMYARVAFANAIHVNPDVLIVDEILGVGDAKFQEKCYHKIRNLRDAGACILFVSHSTEVIQRNCEFAILLESGRLLKYGPADAIVAAYHDLLYGSQEAGIQSSKALPIDRDDVVQETGGVELEAELEEFLASDSKTFFLRFPYYNPNHRRLGNGNVEIVDFLVSANGKLHFNVLEGSETLTVYLKVRFNCDVDIPRVGWAIASPEGIVIAGSNTVMKNIPLPSAHDGETWVYAIEIKPSFSGGQYFINAGVGKIDNETWTFLDNRRSLIHLAVAQSEQASGFVEMPSNCAVLREPSGYI